MLKDKYIHNEVESGKYDKWISEGYFEAGDLTKKPYSIVIPPPNVTGKLHLGHAFDNTFQDLLARYKRLRGYDVLWVPGMDHAGIATQAKVEEKLRKEGINKYEIGREKFLEKSWQWKEEYADFIRKQWALLGNSVDYRKEKFTLDKSLSEAVKKVFVDYYKDGLIYQGLRIINWDPVAKTALSNIEVIHKEIKGKMYYFKYNFADGSGFLEVATTRPETMFADVCLVVNPKDERYLNIIGKEVINPANNQIIKIIADEYIDLDFGSGVMKCTPAHDPNDYQLGIKYNLEMPICLNDDGTVNELGGKYQGLDRFECRKLLIKEIEEDGNLIKIEEIIHSVGHSERTDCIVEPYLSKQWFVKMKPLAEKVLEAQQNEETKINFYPKRFEHTFNTWLENIEDWCISRQLWWGHRIPVYYHKDTKEVYCELEEPKDIENYIQDEDVLDTWFSSALWPFSVFDWPNPNEDFYRYYPTSCMVTGYDIIFFWVARMAFSARYFTNQYPFKDCLIHGLIRDSQGRKMSKSLGNGIDPVELIEKYGVDSLRFYLASSTSAGLDTNYNEEKIIASWNFINKLWNASRYVISNIPNDYQSFEIKNPTLVDKWILDKLNTVIKQATLNFDRYDFNIAATEIYSFVWDDFCSSYIEFSKTGLNSENLEYQRNTINTLVYVLSAILRLLHPFIPFVTEEIYLQLNLKKSINLESWPEIFNETLLSDAYKIDGLLEIIKQTRELKVENNLKPSTILDAELDIEFEIEEEIKSILSKMVKLNIVDKIKEETLIRTIKGGKIIFKLNQIVDKEKELLKLKVDIEKVKSEIARCNNILSNEKFVSKAPISKINEEKEKLLNYQKQLEIYNNKLIELTK